MFSLEENIKNNDVFRQITRIISPIIFDRTFPSPGVLLEHQQLRFKGEHRPHLSRPSARIPTAVPLFGKNVYLLAQGHFGEKQYRPKSSKNVFFLIANAMHKAKDGRALYETGTVKLRRQAAHRAGVSQCNSVVGCSAVSRFDVPRYFLLFTRYL